MSVDELDFDAEELAMLRDLFRGEAQEALEVVNTRVLGTGSTRPTKEILTELMRVTHTLKGAAGTVGLNPMVDLAHRLESALAGVDRDVVPWTETTADQIVEITDGMRGYLDAHGTPAGDALVETIRDQIDRIVRPNRRRDSIPPAFVEPPPEPVLEPTPEAPAPEPKQYLRVEPQRIDDLMSSAGELLFDRTRIERRVQLLRTLSRDLARTRQTLHDSLGSTAPSNVPSRASLVATETELAGQAALLSQTTAALLDEIEALRRTIGELQRGLTRIRMESARSLMTHAARTLRALRRATGVHVELRTIGEDTEFDKAVAEQLVDPVTQLLRNAVAHGVEPSGERVARGKPANATITIRARQDGNLLVLEVSDDGRGIDTAVLRDRLVTTGAWSQARAQLANDAEILDALLGTGVSSRNTTDELAGRGIGIGIVRQTVSKLGGEVKLSSTPGRGTTFSLRLPLSTALAQAMLFKVGGQVYAIPNVHVIDTTLVEANATTATVKTETLPVMRLEQLLGHGPSQERKPAVVISFAGKSLVCTVDKLVGPREIIIKPLDPLLAPLTLYAGATISGSGKVQLILDPAQLVRRAYPNAPETTLSDAGSMPMVLAGRALVVDDSRAIREAMTSMLGREGWIVDVAEDGARALQMTRQMRYDLIVTDLEMPELGGFDLIARLRKDERFKSTPIVIITSRANPEHRRRAREMGVRALVAKPITRRKLLEALATR
ncbi:MAG: response regulator [Myxococcota bacterium]|nr:response regulator [Myxococcota bacterium]